MHQEVFTTFLMRKSQPPANLHVEMWWHLPAKTDGHAKGRDKARVEMFQVGGNKLGLVWRRSVDLLPEP